MGPRERARRGTAGDQASNDVAFRGQYALGARLPDVRSDACTRLHPEHHMTLEQ